MTNWKTTACGIASVFMLGAAETPGLPVWASHLLRIGSAATTSIGLLFARDFDKSSEQSGIKPPPTS